MTTTATAAAAAHICSARRAERLRIFSDCAKTLFIYLFLQEKQFYAEVVLLHIHESEKETKEKKLFRYFPSVTWLSQNLKRHKVDSAGPSKCDFKKNKKFVFPPRR